MTGMPSNLVALRDEGIFFLFLCTSQGRMLSENTDAHPAWVHLRGAGVEGLGDHRSGSCTATTHVGILVLARQCLSG
jgi:hypothetical protein